jgi:ubiquinone/menaquinone biosynthesis C-methylase UbiE
MPFFLKFSRFARNLFTLNRDREFKHLLQMLQLKKNDRILDVGSGDGFWTAKLANYCFSVVGLEPSDDLRNYAKELNNPSNIEYLDGFAEKMPFADGSFDKVISISCLEHFASPQQGLCEMARVLRLNGRLAISVDSLLPENSTPGFRVWHQKRHFVTEYFDYEKINVMVGQAGLTLETEKTTYLFRSKVSAYIREIYIQKPKALLPLFPFFWLVVNVFDSYFDQMHGQILMITATR